MNKKDLIDYLGGTQEKAAKRLEYAHRNSITRMPEKLTARMCADVLRRMKAKRIKIPNSWLTQ